MKCPECGFENKETAKNCKKCQRDLAAPPPWFPDWRWHGKVLGTIYVALIIFYYTVTFALKRLPEPYQIRKIPPQMTPWLKH